MFSELSEEVISYNLGKIQLLDFSKLTKEIQQLDRGELALSDQFADYDENV